MKKVLNQLPVFTPASKQLDFSSVTNFDLKKLFAVINLSRNAIIYAAGQQAIGQSAIAGSVITLMFDTTAHASNDILMCIYDDEIAVQQTQDAELAKLSDSILYLVNVLSKSLARLDAQSRQVVILDALTTGLTLSTVTTVTTVTTVSTLTNQQNISGGNIAHVPYNSIPIHLYDRVVVS